MSKREQDEEALRERFRKNNPDRKEKVDALFDQLEQNENIQNEEQEKKNVDAIKTYKDLILQQYEETELNGVKFKFRINATAIEFEERQLIKEPKEKLKYIHRFLVEPQMPLEDWLQMPPEISKYIEQKIMEHFIRGLVQMAIKIPE